MRAIGPCKHGADGAELSAGSAFGAREDVEPCFEQCVDPLPMIGLALLVDARRTHVGYQRLGGLVYEGEEAFPRAGEGPGRRFGGCGRGDGEGRGHEGRVGASSACGRGQDRNRM